MLRRSCLLWCLQTMLLLRPLGEALDGGAVQLTKAEMLETLTGKTTSFAGQDGSSQLITYKSDGSYAGLWALSGTTAPFFGTWSVQDDGQICLVSGNAKTRGQKLCGYWFRMANHYFAASSPSDRSAQIYRRSTPQ